MNLNPVVVIPTYWCGRRSRFSVDRGVAYDHMTPIDKEGELGRCLESLRWVNGIGRIVLLVVAEPGVENQAAEKVRAIANSFTDLDIIVVGESEMRHIHRRFEQMELGALTSTACLTGYGAVRNLGLLVASIFGHDTVIFLDDDEVAPRDFIERAVYGIAMQTPDGSVITAKTGYFFDENESPLAPEQEKWYDRFWNKSKDFNEYITRALKGSRISRANTACGGCMVLHADAYGSVAFDPWIARGEDLDYVLSAYMYGTTVWFDNQFAVRHMPPDGAHHPLRFEQDVYRWFYEVRKIEFAKTQIDLLQVAPANFAPYPGSWLSPSIARRARFTSYLRALGHKDHAEYWRIGNKARKDAAEFARENCSRYFEFQHEWPQIVRALWQDTPLATQLSGARAVSSANPGFTGRFSAVTGSDSRR